MHTSTNQARLAGVLLLGTLALAAAAMTVLPSFDGRPEYFPGWFPALVAQRGRYAAALALQAAAGGLALAAAYALGRAFHSAISAADGATDSDAGSAAGLVAAWLLAVAGTGFVLSAVVGLPGLGVLRQASLVSPEAQAALAEAAHPWVAGQQMLFIMLGLLSLAAALLAAAVGIVQAGGLRWQLAAAVAGLSFMPLAVALALPGEDGPLLLGVAVPVLVWSVGLGAYLAVTGRVARPA